MAQTILLFLAKRLGLARVSKFETRPATRIKSCRRRRPLARGEQCTNGVTRDITEIYGLLLYFFFCILQICSQFCFYSSASRTFDNQMISMLMNLNDLMNVFYNLCVQKRLWWHLKLRLLNEKSPL
jgi:hypothetical protein